MQTISHDFFSQCQNELENHAHFCTDVIIPDQIIHLIKSKNYLEIDRYFATEVSPKGQIFKILSQFCPVKDIEFIISKRSSLDDWEEDGIWHDDGSRILAFTLSLTLTRPEGGVLELRKKGNNLSSFLITPAFGTMIVFKTGVDGYEHKINAVTKGERLIIAGWCTP